MINLEIYICILWKNVIEERIIRQGRIIHLRSTRYTPLSFRAPQLVIFGNVITNTKFIILINNGIGILIPQKLS